MDSYETGLLALTIALKAVLDVAYALLVGTLLSGSALDASDRAPRVALAALQKLAQHSVLVLLAGQVLSLWLQTAAMTDTGLSQALPQLAAVLGETHFGMTWLVGMGATVGVACALLAVRVRGALALQAGSPGWVLASVCVAALAWAKAAASHAADGGDASLAEWVHWVHVCATAAWSGLVMTSALCVLPAFARHAALPARQAYLRGLSRSAAAAMLLVLASGAFNAWRGLGSSAGSGWASLAYSPWGHLLALKLVLTALVIVCGALNRLVYLPRFEREDPGLSLPWEREDRFAALYAAISRLVTIEAGLMALVLACAAWLAQSAPAS